MNKSFSKKRHIQESNLKLEERMLSEYGYYSGMDKDRELATNWYKQNAHTVNNVLQIGSLFIPVIGPLVTAGIGLADAAVYAKEGRTTEAGIVAAFSLIPGMASVVTKIPGVKQLGQKGMTALATKLLAKTPLNSVEQGVMTGVMANAALIRQEANNAVRNMASKAVAKVTDSTTKKSLEHVAKHGLEKGTEHTIAHAVAPHGAQPKVAGTPTRYTSNVNAATRGTSNVNAATRVTNSLKPNV
jgi:TPR repeat protein